MIAGALGTLPSINQLRALDTSGMDLTGRTFLVTGGTDGIGLHTAESLARLGAHTLVHGRCSAV